MKEAPPFAPFDEVVISSRELKDKGKTELKVEGVGKDKQAIADMVAQMKQSVEEGIAELEQQGQPGMDQMVKLMKGLKFYSMGLNGTISAEFDGNPANIVSVFVPMFGMRSVDHAAPPVQAAPPAKVP